MEHMRRIAFETVLRACGFGSLAIFCVMIGMSFEPRLAFQAGGTLTTMMVAVETIREANISVSGTLPNRSAGARICIWISENSSHVWLNRPLIIPKEARPT